MYHERSIAVNRGTTHCRHPGEVGTNWQHPATTIIHFSNDGMPALWLSCADLRLLPHWPDPRLLFHLMPHRDFTHSSLFPVIFCMLMTVFALPPNMVFGSITIPSSGTGIFPLSGIMYLSPCTPALIFSCCS